MSTTTSKMPAPKMAMFVIQSVQAVKHASKLHPGKSYLAYEVKDTEKKTWIVNEDVYKLCFDKCALEAGDIVMGHFKLSQNGFKVMTCLKKVTSEKACDLLKRSLLVIKTQRDMLVKARA